MAIHQKVKERDVHGEILEEGQAEIPPRRSGGDLIKAARNKTALMWCGEKKLEEKMSVLVCT